MTFFSNLVRVVSNPSKNYHDSTAAVPASHGASLENHDPPSTALRRLVSIETTKQIVSQGNLGSTGMDALREKAVNQKERVAERSRLKSAGLFEAHMPHEQMVNLSPKHRAVADGANLFVDTPFKLDSSSSHKV